MCLTCRRKKWILRLFCAFILLSIIFVVYRINKAVKENKCEDAQLKHMLRSVCQSYKDGQVSGSLCLPLCDRNEVQYVKCLNYKEGKKIIFASWRSKTVILKAKHLQPSSYEILTYLPSMTAYLSQVRDKVNGDFGISDTKTDQELLFKLWTGVENLEDLMNANTLEISKITQQQSVMRSLWSLIHQDEYLFLQYFSDNPVLPRIYGSCGHVYAMEYAPSTGILDPALLQITGVSSYSWHERVKIAVDLMNIIKTAEEDFGEPLHFCDVKGSNFGVGQDGRVKPIDTDTVFLRSKLEQAIAFMDSCNKSSDCDFFDCKGSCNLTSRRCQRKVLNNNLEAFCRKIFTSGINNMYFGLLMNPPAEYESRLGSILDSCLKLVDGDLERSKEVFEHLNALLQEGNKFS